MLFGLPPKMRSFYRPKSSSKLGGRLTLIDDHGEAFTIERLDQVRNGAAVCYTPDGGEHDEAWLTDRLKGMTSATYQSIYSFRSEEHTSELQSRGHLVCCLLLEKQNLY